VTETDTTAGVYRASRRRALTSCGFGFALGALLIAAVSTGVINSIGVFLVAASPLALFVQLWTRITVIPGRVRVRSAFFRTTEFVRGDSDVSLRPDSGWSMFPFQRGPVLFFASGSDPDKQVTVFLWKFSKPDRELVPPAVREALR
jgi:hypothetical protein